ncbi:MAG: ABC transporter ATP-binding protein [Cryomorphaceae bacterium]|nr:MAG: ABC transporter ATP-binding protein [Cryomorphaceae bacterium]
MTTHQAMLRAENLSKRFPSGGNEITVLDSVTFQVDRGETCAIVGPSGSGKTTLLGLCAGLDQASSGSVMLQGTAMEKLSEDERAALRSERVGFIFQQFNLLPGLTALENVMVPMELRKMERAAQRGRELLAEVGLADRAHHYPVQLSGGEQQRVAIARAYANNPAILFADEPTGNLDEDTGAQIEALIFDLNREHQTTLVVVTHDMELASRTSHIIRLKGGKIVEESSKTAQS